MFADLLKFFIAKTQVAALSAIHKNPNMSVTATNFKFPFHKFIDIQSLAIAFSTLLAVLPEMQGESVGRECALPHDW